MTDHTADEFGELKLTVIEWDGCNNKPHFWINRCSKNDHWVCISDQMKGIANNMGPYMGTTILLINVMFNNVCSPYHHATMASDLDIRCNCWCFKEQRRCKVCMSRCDPPFFSDIDFIKSLPISFEFDWTDAKSMQIRPTLLHISMCDVMSTENINWPIAAEWRRCASIDCITIGPDNGVTP